MRFEQLELTGGGTLTLYLRESVEAMPHFRQRPLVLVVPGGGYNHVSPREGDPVALQFAAAGYHTAVLHYAVGESARDALPMRQLAQAIGLVRQHAEQWNILPDKIALCGFSAGGHLALSGAVWDIPGMADQPRPNALLLAYPVVTAEEYAHRGSFVQLTGTQDTAAHRRFSLEDKVSPTTPPVFVWHYPWRTRPSRWRTPCCCSVHCTRRAFRVRHTCLKKAATAPASPPRKWMPTAPTATTGCSWRWSG